jgi:RNA-directed DNA polymerase
MNKTVESIAQDWGEQILQTYLRDAKFLSLKNIPKQYVIAAMFLKLNSPYTLARVFKTTINSLEKRINNGSYNSFYIPKRKGGQRLIEVPETPLLKTQKGLNFFLQAYYACIKPQSVHGFIKTKSYSNKPSGIISNASMHINKATVLNIDLKDFFQNISSKQVFQLFRSPLFNFNENMAAAYTLLCTHKGHLPTGAPTSPILSNFICLELDRAMQQFCLIHELSYSRYADDLSFSSNQHISTNTLLDLISAINALGFQINDKKVRMQGRRGRQTVTGLVVNQKVNVDRRYIRKLRAALHDLELNGLANASTKHFKLQETASEAQQQHFISRIQAQINFVGSVRGKDDEVFLKLKLKFVGLWANYEKIKQVTLE